MFWFIYHAGSTTSNPISSKHSTPSLRHICTSDAEDNNEMSRTEGKSYMKKLKYKANMSPC